jgi:hypothetical protein
VYSENAYLLQRGFRRTAYAVHYPTGCAECSGVVALEDPALPLQDSPTSGVLGLFSGHSLWCGGRRRPASSTRYRIVDELNDLPSNKWVDNFPAPDMVDIDVAAHLVPSLNFKVAA